MKVRFRARALADIDRIRRYIHKRSPGGAGNVLRAIFEAIDFIGENPDASQKIDRRGGRMKVVTQYPYKVFYAVHSDYVEILHVRHSMRRPWRVIVGSE